MLNFYTVIDAESLKQIRVRRSYGETFEPEVNDVVFLDEEPVAKVAVVSDLDDNRFDVTLDRPVSILIGRLVVMGIP